MKTVNKKINYKNRIYGEPVSKVNDFFTFSPLQLREALLALQNVNGKVLDVGCGSGGMLRSIRQYRKDLRLYGIDISSKAIAEAKKCDRDIEFKSCSAYSLPFHDSSLDAVVSFDCLEHLIYINKALKEISRVLKKNGTFYLCIPMEGDLATLNGIIAKITGIEITRNTHGHVQQLTENEIRLVLIKNNFVIKRIRYYGFFLKQILNLFQNILLKFSGSETVWIKKRVEQNNLMVGFKINKLIDFLVFLVNIESFLLNRFRGHTALIACIKK